MVTVSVFHACLPTPSGPLSCRECRYNCSVRPLRLVLGFAVRSRSQAFACLGRLALWKPLWPPTYGTVLQPGFLSDFPGLMRPRDLAQSFYKACASEGLHPGLKVGDLCAALKGVDLEALQVYWADTQMRGLADAPQGPDWASQKNAAAAWLPADKEAPGGCWQPFSCWPPCCYVGQGWGPGHSKVPPGTRRG